MRYVIIIMQGGKHERRKKSHLKKMLSQKKFKKFFKKDLTNKNQCDIIKSQLKEILNLQFKYLEN